MARSRRDRAILPRIGAKLGNSTPTDLHHDVFGLGKVAHLAPGILGKWGASAHSPTGASMAWSHTRRRHGLAMSTANDDLSTTQPLWRVPLTRTLVQQNGILRHLHGRDTDTQHIHSTQTSSPGKSDHRNRLWTPHSQQSWQIKTALRHRKQQQLRPLHSLRSVPTVGPQL